MSRLDVSKEIPELAGSVYAACCVPERERKKRRTYLSSGPVLVTRTGSGGVSGARGFCGRAVSSP